MIHSSSLKALTVFTSVVVFLFNAPLLASSGWQESTKNDYEALKTQHATLEPYESNSRQALTGSAIRRLSNRRCSNERSFFISPLLVVHSLLFILGIRSLWNSKGIVCVRQVLDMFGPQTDHRGGTDLREHFIDHMGKVGESSSAKLAELMQSRC
jgi:hypothetical protein